MLRAIASVVVVLIAGCAPESDGSPDWDAIRNAPGTRALFDACQAARPFEVGETMQRRWVVSTRVDELRVEHIGGCDYRGGGAATRYGMSRPGARGVMGNETFFPIADTPEDDFIVQTVTPSEDVSFVSYTFMWRTRDGWAVTAAMHYDDLDERARRFCVRPAGERRHARHIRACYFASARQVIGYYREVVYPQVRNQTETNP